MNYKKIKLQNSRIQAIYSMSKMQSMSISCFGMRTLFISKPTFEWKQKIKLVHVDWEFKLLLTSNQLLTKIKFSKRSPKQCLHKNIVASTAFAENSKT